MPEGTNDRILLDTHALLWWLAASDLLSRQALELINGASAIGLSPISFWEVAMLQSKGRVQLNKPIVAWMNGVLLMDRITTADVKPAIAIDAGQLADFHGDPADRLIYATAATERMILITKDEKLSTYARARSDVVVAW